MSEGMLSGLKVLDLGGRLGGVCGRFLATLGADVVKLEPPDGEPGRRTPADAPDHGWLAENLGKRSVTADLDTPQGQALVRQLAERADFLIEACAPGWLAARGLAHADLAKLNPRLIHVSITPFGQTGPYAGFVGGELVCSALSGVLFGVGYEDRAPVKEALNACIFHANGAAAAGAMFAHVERARSGLGQHVDVSVQQVATSRLTNPILVQQFDDRLLTRSGQFLSYGKVRIRTVWTLKDGYCFHALPTGRFGAPANAALSKWMDDEGFNNPMQGVDWIKHDRSAVPPETRATWEAAIDVFFRSKTKADIAGEGRRRGINAVPANEPADVLNDAHLAERNFLASFEHEGRTLRLPDRFLSSSATPTGTPGPTPEAGQHTRAVLADWLGQDQMVMA
ncbi:MAG: CaiB/BaiF CoA-transferase family protein [Caulobacteraceae bacterium]